MMELLAILLIFSLGAIVLGVTFVGGVAFVFKKIGQFLSKIFGDNS